MFYLPLLHLVDEGGNPCPRVMGMTKHTTPDTGQMRLTAVSHIYSQLRGGGHHSHAGPCGGCSWEQMNKTGSGVVVGQA